MKIIYIYLLFGVILFSCTKLFAQEKLQKVIVIDTVEREPIPKNKRFKGMRVSEPHFYRNCNLVSIYCQPFFFDCWEDEYIECVDKLNGNEYPNLVVTVNQIPGFDYLSISIDLDEKGSSLKLLNIDQVKEDTIRINKWKLYKNRLVDTTYGGRVYSKKENDSMVFQAYKVERIFKYDDFKPDTLKQIQVRINDIEYALPLVVQKGEVVVVNFHGREEPYRVYKRYMKYLDRHDGEEPKKKKFKYDVIWGDYSTTQYIYSATIDFATTAP